MAFLSNSGDLSWSRDRERLMRMLRQLEVGQVLTYAVAAEAIGRTRVSLRNMFFECKKRLARDEGMVFGAVREVGWKRLSAAETVVHGGHDLRKGRRHFRRACDRAKAVKTSELTREQTLTHNVNSSLLGTLNAMSIPQRRASVERKLANGDIDVGDIAGAFRDLNY